MGVGHERRELVLHPEELVHRVVVPLKFFALDLDREEPLEHLRGKALRGVLARERVLRAVARDFFSVLSACFC